MLPMKTRILQYATEKGDGITLEEVMTALEPEYGGEGMFSTKQVGEYLDSFLGVGLLKADELELDGDGSLHITYGLTEAGKSRGARLVR